MKTTLLILIITFLIPVHNSFAQYDGDDDLEPYTTIGPNGGRYTTLPQPDGGSLTTDGSGNRWLTLPPVGDHLRASRERSMFPTTFLTL